MKTILTSILCLLTLGLGAQNIIISGAVLDANTQKPVAYAHVGVPALAIGTISADNGKFVLKLPAKAKSNLLRISFIGYKSYEIAVADFEKGSDIQLTQATTNLTEIIVTDESKVEDIIRRAVRKIPKNYPNYPTTNTGFYRESKTDSNQVHTYLAEGVLKTHKLSYTKKKEGHVQIVEGRQVALVPDSILRRTGYFTSGHMSGLRFDVVQNREDFIDEKYFPSYKYWIAGVTSYNDRPVYIIGFDQEGDAKDGRMRGKIFIDTLSLAFIRTEFEITEEGIKKQSDYPLYSGRWKANKYIVNYRQQGDRWILGDATREGVYRDGGLYMNEYLVTEAPEGKGKPLAYMERIGRESAFRDITGEYDKDFWKDYNTSPLKEDLRETVSQKETTKLAEEVFTPENMERLKLRQDSIRMKQEDMVRSNTSAYLIETAKAKAFKGFQILSYSGVGVHMIQTPGAKMSMTYFKDSDKTEGISVTENVSEKQREYIYRSQMDFLFKDKFAFSWGFNYEFLDAIYKNVSLGVTYQQRLNKGRPLFFRLGVHYDRTKYMVKVGQAENTIGEFEAEKKTFKADKINMYYGSRARSLMGTASLSLELNPGTEIFVQAAYRRTFKEIPTAYLWERERFFLARKKEFIKDFDRLEVTRDDMRFDSNITDFNNWQFTIGVVKKTNFN